MRRPITTRHTFGLSIDRTNPTLGQSAGQPCHFWSKSRKASNIERQSKMLQADWPYFSEDGSN